ncbi:MAG: ribosomal protein S18-alanine N-acetyltransferase [Clostridia bacterium]|nr:ribosomal protein S18-alanine N-acetyltransferase [Clostridia bacterium]
MSVIQIVSMNETHLQTLAALEACCFADPWSEDALREELKNPLARFLVALCDGEVAGYLGCHHIVDEAFVANVAVFPAFRRQGVGRALVEAAKEQAAALYRLTLEVRASNAPAIALYRSLGFVEDGIRPHFYAHPTEDAVLYSYYPTRS